MKLFFDTETSGLANFKIAPEHESQPRVVQLALLLTDNSGVELSHAKILVKPEGWVISEEASKITGITTDHATKYGISKLAALFLFSHFAFLPDTELIAFNLEFDQIVLSGEYIRSGKVNPFTKAKAMCEMKAMMDIVKLPPRYAGQKYKWPKLSEAYEFAFKKPIHGAHDALADVRATRDVHFWRLNQPQDLPI